MTRYSPADPRYGDDGLRKLSLYQEELDDMIESAEAKAYEKGKQDTLAYLADKIIEERDFEVYK